MPGYRYKDQAELAYDDFKARLRVEGNRVLARVMNEALAEGTRRFNEQLNQGGVPQLEVTPETLRELLLSAAQRELAAPHD